ncbi:hypothetical protein HU200_024886 [Digitaria exilis]|uniref:Uncharacterized protein n=1 Tax=Digitaria exilis TaxID=1010633 RepID=A0A835C3P0_9POAL|nr:hypothetical protein HU200_024886 [Digitaria exilis]
MDQPLVRSIPLRRFVDENWCAVDEAKDGPDPKSKIIDRLVEESEEERNGGGNEEKNGGSGYTVDEDDSEDDMKGWDDNGDPYLPFRYRLAVSCPEGQHYTVQQAEEIFEAIRTGCGKRNGTYFTVPI